MEKKTYIAPARPIILVNLEHHLMDLSSQGSASISSRTADGDAFVKGDGSSRQGYNVWDDDWSN